ncbi:TRIC cation channel family protein [Amycolatopsis sp. NBC_00345]|uniref:trimeric intracellular cation channel family protein n=1 Tax=Amycolatopsis sp. NBC_00345 TaxID=2975955 RepID=UPI002E257DBC
MLTVLEVAGILAFAFAGASEAVQSGLDFFGVVTAATITAIGGGVLRDLLLGVHLPAGLLTWWYYVACAATAIMVFSCRRWSARLTGIVQIADAIGLAMFADTGASAATAHGAPFYAAALIGMTNGIGGGMIVDVLLRRTPVVLRQGVYALPALGAGLIVALGTKADLPRTPLTLTVVVLVLGVRLLAIKLNWNLAAGRPHRVLRQPRDPAFDDTEIRSGERTQELPRVPVSGARPAPAPVPRVTTPSPSVNPPWPARSPTAGRHSVQRRP